MAMVTRKVGNSLLNQNHWFPKSSKQGISLQPRFFNLILVITRAMRDKVYGNLVKF
jgi:hypothetical protein